jgi:hypothetical protein
MISGQNDLLTMMTDKLKVGPKLLRSILSWRVPHIDMTIARLPFNPHILNSVLLDGV